MTQQEANPLVLKLNSHFPLAASEREFLEGISVQPTTVPPHTDVVREGDRRGACTLLLDGMVYRYKMVETGSRQIMSFHTAGDIFDAQSFMLEVMDHSVRTVTRCKVAAIPHSTMVALTEHPRIARAIWKDSLIDAAIFREWIVNVGRRNAHARLAHLICELFMRQAAVGIAQGLRMWWPMTQIELADATGLSTVHVNRTLMRLRRENLIDQRGDQLTIKNWDRLVTAGEFDPLYLHIRSPSGQLEAAHL